MLHQSSHPFARDSRFSAPMQTPANLLQTYASDGTPLAYCVTGEGSTLVLANGFSTSNFFWNYLYPRWIRNHRVVTFDYKGHGRSGRARTAAGASISAAADDLLRVMDAAEVEQATLIGFSMGCQVIFEAYRQQANRVCALIPLLGPAGRVFDSALRPLGVGKAIHRLMRDLPTDVLHPLMRVSAQAARLPGALRLARALRVIGPKTRPSDVAHYIRHFATVDPRTVAEMAVSAQEHSTDDLLPSITCPCLIVNGDRDPFAPVELTGELMHQTIPNSEHVVLSGGTHTSLFDHPTRIANEVEQFLQRHGLV